jgi:ArsR family transcriptional regulator
MTSMNSTQGICTTPDEIDSSLAPLDDSAIANLAKALGHPLRVRIIRLLSERNSCITGDLVSELPVAQSTVSEHLRILREAGLIQGQIEGPRVSYCINRTRLDALRRALDALPEPPN